MIPQPVIEAFSEDKYLSRLESKLQQLTQGHGPNAVNSTTSRRQVLTSVAGMRSMQFHSSLSGPEADCALGGDGLNEDQHRLEEKQPLLEHDQLGGGGGGGQHTEGPGIAAEVQSPSRTQQEIAQIARSI